MAGYALVPDDTDDTDVNGGIDAVVVDDAQHAPVLHPQMIVNFPDVQNVSIVPRHDEWAEPWYYLALEIFAYIILTLGTAQLVLPGLLFVSWLLRSGSGGESTLFGLGISFPFISISICVFIGSVLASAPILLLVDIGRSLRRLRRTLCP